MRDDFLSDEDKALFQEYMREVKPLTHKQKTIASPKPEKKPLKKSPPKESMIYSSPVTYCLSDFIQEPVFSETILSYFPPHFALAQKRALKNGQIPWEARLDLHGYQIEKARDSLCRFIQAQQDKRCVLIIHGKGGHQGSPPVIKNLINRWLPQMDEILAFHSAHAKDGGSGALYVLMKRNKPAGLR